MTIDIWVIKEAPTEGIIELIKGIDVWYKCNNIYNNESEVNKEAEVDERGVDLNY